MGGCSRKRNSPGAVAPPIRLPITVQRRQASHHRGPPSIAGPAGRKQEVASNKAKRTAAEWPRCPESAYGDEQDYTVYIADHGAKNKRKRSGVLPRSNSYFSGTTPQLREQPSKNLQASPFRQLLSRYEKGALSRWGSGRQWHVERFNSSKDGYSVSEEAPGFDE